MPLSRTKLLARHSNAVIRPHEYSIDFASYSLNHIQLFTDQSSLQTDQLMLALGNNVFEKFNMDLDVIL